MMEQLLVKLWEENKVRQNAAWELMGTDKEHFEFHRGRWSAFVEASKALSAEIVKLRGE